MSEKVKLFSFFLIICVIICFSSCSPSPKSYITWQKFPLSFSGYIHAEDFFSSQQNGIKVNVNLTAPYTGSITVLSPENLAGYTVSINSGKADISYSNITTQLPTALSSQIMLLFSLFDLNEDDLTSVNITEHNGINTNQAIFSVYLPIEYSGRAVNEQEENFRIDSEIKAEDRIDDDKMSIKVGEVKVYIDVSNDMPIMFEASFGEKNLVIDIEKFVMQEN